jgi:hypothetical protein
MVDSLVLSVLSMESFQPNPPYTDCTDRHGNRLIDPVSQSISVSIAHSGGCQGPDYTILRIP